MYDYLYVFLPKSVSQKCSVLYVYTRLFKSYGEIFGYKMSSFKTKHFKMNH